MPPRIDPSLEERKNKHRERLSALGQEHVLKWWDELSGTQRGKLLDQLDTIDLGLLEHLMHSADDVAVAAHTPERLTAPPYIPLPSSDREHAEHRTARQVGEEALSAGRAAVITVAGGQSTRLKSDKPKGTFPIGPVTNKSLYQMHAEQVLAIGRRYGVALPWAIMVSDATDQPSRDYFREHDYFGLSSDDVIFFRQGMLPALDFQRRLILTDKDTIFLSPDGHGGAIRALHEDGVLDKLERRGVRHMFYFQVDNAAVNVGDPAFLGYHVQANAEMSFKVLPRRDAEEKVGVMVAAEGALRVIEYSDMSREHKHARYKAGRLLLPMGSPAIHILDVRFVRRLARAGWSMPHHVARKPIPYLDENGRKVSPVAPNGFKFEMFIFDALPLAANPVLVEMDRAEEFAPVKNLEGEDSPSTARRILSEKFARLLERAGAVVPRDERGAARTIVEISPIYALDADELARKLPRGFKVEGEKLYLGPDPQT